jgi:NADH-quinone oxidoreductase subunit L
MTHAFFKALLFLGAGSVIHALSGEQDLRKMGGLASRLPWTHRTMLVATIAIAGIPPFAGFFSKDEILHDAFASGHLGIWAVGLVTALLTAFYMFRLYVLTFRGPSRLTHEAEHHLHESPPSMIVPLVVLALLAIVGGWVGPPLIPAGNPFQHWLAPVFDGATHGVAGTAGVHPVPPGIPEVSVATELILIALSVLAAVTGILLAFRFYLRQPSIATALEARFRGVHEALVNKYWVDELYDAVVVRTFYRAALGLWRFWDEKIVDGIVNGIGYTLEGVSAVLRLFQTGFVGTYALFFTFGVLALFLFFARH